MKSDILVEETGIETAKAIYCNIYRAETDYQTSTKIWLAKSQIEEKWFSIDLNENCIDVTYWYFVKVLNGQLDPDNSGQFASLPNPF